MSDWFSGVPIPPGLILVLGAFLIPQFRGTVRQALVLLLPLLTLCWIWLLPDGSHVVFPLMDYALEPVNSTPAGRLFATIFAITAGVGGLYALHRATVVELTAAFFYAGSAIGVAFSGDLLTLFIYWEMMALGSAMVLWANVPENPRAYNASMRYLMIHLFGGVVLMSGIVAYAYQSGSISFGAMQPDNIGTILIMAGFLINAGAPPLSAWVADAYPEASASGMVFLSAFTTKTAVFALLVGFPGVEILIYIGLYMVFYGIIYALLENDMRRILAYSIVSQVGFMVTSIGIGTEMALNGVAAHAFAHIIYKALLLMAAGSVLMHTGKRQLTELGGLFQRMPMTTIFALIGGASIAAFPFTSGFVTKSLETGAAAYDGQVLVWFLLLAASAGTFLYAGLKFSWFVFFHRDAGLQAQDPAPKMQLAMGIMAFFCIALGIFPEPLYNLLPYQQDIAAHAKSYQQYTLSHVVYQMQIMAFTALVFFGVLLPLMKPGLTITLDFDWFYRRLFSLIGREFTFKVSAARDKTEVKTRAKIERFIGSLKEYHGPQGILGKTWPSGSMVLWVAVLLVSSLGLYYLR